MLNICFTFKFFITKKLQWKFKFTLATNNFCSFLCVIRLDIINEHEILMTSKFLTLSKLFAKCCWLCILVHYVMFSKTYTENNHFIFYLTLRFYLQCFLLKWLASKTLCSKNFFLFIFLIITSYYFSIQTIKFNKIIIYL